MSSGGSNFPKEIISVRFHGIVFRIPRQTGMHTDLQPVEPYL